jgi:hypothetical protein
MDIDLRQPIGILFLAYGVILSAYGFVRPQLILGLNIDLIWGVVLAVFGAGMLALARRGRSAKGRRPAG